MMTTDPNVLIFTGPVQSGKTSRLMKWASDRDDVAGILMPDVNGLRHFYDLSEKEFFPAECYEPNTATEPVFTVGKYTFYTNAFEKAKNIVRTATEPAFVIVDEAGRLELEGGGFYEVTSEIISKKQSGKIILVVREALVNDVKQRFRIPNAVVVTDPEVFSKV